MIPFYESVNGGPPEPITALTPAAWYRYGIGITVNGQGVSSWADQSGNGRDLLQGTDGARPPLQADNSILFNGTDEFLAAAFTLNQPESVYILFNPVSFTANDRILDGATLNTGGVIQTTSTPTLRLNAGTNTAGFSGPAVGVYGVVAAVFNGASSVQQFNNNTPVVADAGLGNMGGLTLGANGVAVGNYANIQVKEVIVFAAAHDAATRATVITYLATVGGLNI